MAEASGGQENQEISPIKAPVQTENSAENVSQKSLMRDLIDYASGKIDFKKSSHVIESVDRSEIEALVRKIGEAYDVPQRAIENGLKAEIFVVKDDSFTKLQESRIRAKMKDEISKTKTIEELNKIEQFIREEAQLTEGNRWPAKSGKEIILIREKSGIDRESLETHEILHVMAQDEASESAGFEKEGGIWTNINEATTEILALHLLYPNLNSAELYLKIDDNKIANVGYESLVKKMLIVMGRPMVDGNGVPFSFKELAQYYFHNVQAKDNDVVGSMTKDIASRLMPEAQERTISCLANDLQTGLF